MITAKNQTQSTIMLVWDVNHADCNMIMIIANGTNLMNVSYYTESAIVEIANYTLQDWILIEVYCVNHCGHKSEDPTTLLIGKSYCTNSWHGIQDMDINAVI